MKKKILFVAMFASISLASNAKEKVTTSCGETYVIEMLVIMLPKSSFRHTKTIWTGYIVAKILK